MWIRTQSKLRLIKCDNIVITKGTGMLLGKYMIESNSIVLGAYSTEEKALKVLDMIEKRINDFSCSSIVNIPVFQMPQDEEVF